MAAFAEWNVFCGPPVVDCADGCFMLHFFTLLLWLISPTFADSYDEAEFVRLRSEMHMLAEREAWSGVEKAYAACDNLGGTFSFNDYLLGAYAAQARGDIKEARTRLWAAHQIQEDKEVIDWLWKIDTQYAKVVLRSNPDTPLTFLTGNFNPRLSMYLKQAQNSLNRTTEFIGYLPPGTYALGSTTFVLKTETPPLEVDQRTLSAKRLNRYLSQR